MQDEREIDNGSIKEKQQLSFLPNGKEPEMSRHLERERGRRAGWRGVEEEEVEEEEESPIIFVADRRRWRWKKPHSLG